jgi:phospholipid/cholesterol/gamma-HCH transport system ATP-binding protein
VIAFRDVHKAFGPKRVLAGFSLEIPDGQTTVIVGHSGAGKSVALKLVVGLLDPDHGSVEVDGQVVHTLDRERLTAVRARIGFVFQFAALFDSMTVAENLALGLRRQGLAESEIADRSADALAVVGLAGTEARLPSELSGGMRKRVGIARAIVLRPKFILYDEPTTGLDPVTAAVIDQLMVRTRETYGVTSVVVTHDMRSAYTVGDRIAMLFRGQVRQVGPVEAIRGSHDAVVRQFVEGRPEGAQDAEAAWAAGA